MTEATVEHVDILIVGAGPVGLTLHLALATGGQQSLLLDRQRDSVVPGDLRRGAASPLGVLAAAQNDPRALALSQGTRQLLEQIGAWPKRAATPIETIHISQKDGFGLTLIDRNDYALPALGYVIRYRDLAAALTARLAADTIIAGAEILTLTTDDDGVEVTLRQDGAVRRLKTRLLVHAEGTPDDEPAVQVSDYAQHAVICEVTPNPGHAQRAWERFTPDGPLALLPLGGEFSVVFTLPPTKADSVMAMDDAAFTAALQRQFGRRMTFSKPGPRRRFPLALRLRKTLVKGHEVWIGNTAQTLHPVSGQGFNLGIRDAWQLAEALLSEGISPASLARYAASRQLDRRGSAFFTDRIVRTFSNDFAPLKLARGLGLLALDLCPPARHFVAKRMIWGARAWP
ncbi:MAG: 2-octaprenyl-6-methoxyphenol hydroxylase [Proteobacteria bacterium]|nr:2-octaprenyl-6-methoxyphenol hydroxylase [Pseudomonadota bacterium]